MGFRSEGSAGKAVVHRKGRTVPVPLAAAVKSLRGLGQMTGRSPAVKVFCSSAHPFAIALLNYHDKIRQKKGLYISFPPIKKRK